MLPPSVKVPVPFDFAFGSGALALRVEKLTDFSRRGQDDDQARDKDTGERLWAVTLLDLDERAGRFGQDRVKVKVASPVQPVPPASAVPGYPPAVELTDLVLVPWVDTSRCVEKCKARLAWSMRASGLIAPEGVSGAGVAA